MNQEKLKLYYWGHPIIRYVYNFGDLLSPLLLKHYCGESAVELSLSAENGDVFSTGSIIEHIPEDKYAIILGSGLIQDAVRKLPFARCYAVRGELTKARLGITEDIPLGDPALLLPKVLPFTGVRDKAVGIVPHFQHYSHPDLDPFRNNPDYRVINVRAEPEYVIKEICSCSCIVSSSLHGLIVADAYGIPNIRLAVGHTLYGGDYKFEDYYSAIGRTGTATKSIFPTEIAPDMDISTDYMCNIPAVQEKLEQAFCRFTADIPMLQEEKRSIIAQKEKLKQGVPSPYRLDVKCLSGMAELGTSSVSFSQPEWLSDATAPGWLVQGRTKNNAPISLQFHALKDSKLLFKFRGLNKLVNGIRVPAYSFYNQITVNGKELLKMPMVAWHDKPYSYVCECRAGDSVSVVFELLPIESLD